VSLSVSFEPRSPSLISLLRRRSGPVRVVVEVSLSVSRGEVSMTDPEAAETGEGCVYLHRYPIS